MESYDLTVRTEDRDGVPAFASAALVGLDAGTIDFIDVDGSVLLRLPRAHYTLFTILDGNLFMAFPRLTLDRDFVADLDGRFAKPIAGNRVEQTIIHAYALGDLTPSVR